ncbi:MAG: LON peptidase substrate-binding domain-containing protein, partial [Deltaproteobacteria bacterium]
MDVNEQITTGIDEFPDLESLNIPEELPMMAVRDVVIFSYMIVPLFVGRPTSISAVSDALAKDKFILLVTQKDATIDDPTAEDLYRVGMVGMIMRTLKMPDGRLKVLVQALSKAKIKEIVQEEPHYLA